MNYYFENDITASIGLQKYLCKITWRKGTFLIDEPEKIGGRDLGPDPYSALLAALAACTLSTLRMYIDRKGWDIPEIDVSLNLIIHQEEDFFTEIKREISFPKSITAEQRERLLVIAAKCPVSKILENKIIIHTTL